MPDVIQFPPGVPEISLSQEWDGRMVTVTLTFDHQNRISTSLSPSGRLCQISLQAFLRYHVHQNGTDVKDNPKT